MGSFVKQISVEEVNYLSRNIIDPFCFLPVDIKTSSLEESIRLLFKPETLDGQN